MLNSGTLWYLSQGLMQEWLIGLNTPAVAHVSVVQLYPVVKQQMIQYLLIYILRTTTVYFLELDTRCWLYIFLRQINTDTSSITHIIIGIRFIQTALCFTSIYIFLCTDNTVLIKGGNNFFPTNEIYDAYILFYLHIFLVSLEPYQVSFLKTLFSQRIILLNKDTHRNLTM